jgi:hypothetical protein
MDRQGMGGTGGSVVQLAHGCRIGWTTRCCRECLHRQLRRGCARRGGGTIGHVGNDVYAGRDGNVYRNTGDGWQKHSAGRGWNDVAGSREGPATRDAAARLGSARDGGGFDGARELDQQRSARDFGGARASQVQRSSMNMNRSFGGGRGGGGFRRR